MFNCLRCFFLNSSHPSFLHGFPLRHRMQQAHNLLVAKLLRHVVGCPASVDRSWWGQCCRLSYDLQSLDRVQWWVDFTQFWLQLTEMRFAQFSCNSVQLMRWWWLKPKPNSNCLNPWISRDCPSAKALSRQMQRILASHLISRGLLQKINCTWRVVSCWST